MAKKRPLPQTQKTDWKRAVVWGVRLIVPTLIGAGVVYGGLLLTAGLIESPKFHLSRIEYQGVHHLDREALNGLIEKNIPQNLWLIDLEDVRQMVESENWVESAVIRRQFPSQLQIFVRERTPVAVAAIGDDLWVVDRHGAMLDDYGPDYSDLDNPIVTGLKNTALENAREENAARMGAYLRLLNDLDAADPGFSKQLSEIDVSNPGRVAVVPTRQAIPVYLGSEHFAERYRTFLSQAQLLERLRQQHGAIESVDLTYENRIIVHTPRSSQSKGAEHSKAS